MPNAIKMLQDDHNSVRVLCKQLPTLPGGNKDEEEKAAIQIVSMLRTHTTLEEELVYPVLAESHPDLIDHAQEEHAEASQLLDEIEKMSAGMELREAVMELLRAVEAHVSDEEETVFPLLTEALGVSGLEDLGRQMLGRQQDLMQAAPDTTGALTTAQPQITTPRI